MRVFCNVGSLEDVKCCAVNVVTVTNSRTLIDTNRPSLLSLLKSRVHWMILSELQMCHQNPSAIKKPPAPSNKLSPIVVANGV